MLNNLRVASPCPANWQEMNGDDRVRHCAQCNLNVYNLSAMTEPEVEKLISQREGRLCVRFYQRADGTVLTRDCPVGLWRRVRRISQAAGAVLCAAFFVPFASGQNKQNGSQPLMQINDASGGITVNVSNESGVSLSHAQVQLADEKGKQISQG